MYMDGNFFLYFLLFLFWFIVVGGEEFSGIESCFKRIVFVLIFVVVLLFLGLRGGVFMLIVVVGSYWFYKILGGWCGWVLGIEVLLMVVFLLVFIVYVYYGFENIVVYVSLDIGNESGFFWILVWYVGIKFYFLYLWLGVGFGNFVMMGKGDLLFVNYV